MTIIADLPGLSKSDINVELQNDRLTIAGSTSQSSEYSYEKAKVTHSERSFGEFRRTLTVPRGLKAEDVKASMENGVLKVELPAKTKEEETKKIEVA